MEAGSIFEPIWNFIATSSRVIGALISGGPNHPLTWRHRALNWSEGANRLNEKDSLLSDSSS